MNLKRIFIASLLVFVVSFVFRMLTCGWLFKWVYMIPPMIWKDPSEMQSISAMLTGILFSYLSAFLFPFGYALLYNGIPKEGASKGILYGIIIWLICSFPGMISMPTYMTISWAIVIYWLIQILILNIANGAIVGAIYKK